MLGIVAVVMINDGKDADKLVLTTQNDSLFRANDSLHIVNETLIKIDTYESSWHRELKLNHASEKIKSDKLERLKPDEK
jgi:hypothetical protein